MRKRKSAFNLIGYEDYKLYEIGNGCFTYDSLYYYRYCHKCSAVHPCGSQMLLSDMNLFINPIKEMPSIPDSGNIWIHQSCKIPRKQVYTKYKRVKDPYEADIVVIHKSNSSLYPPKLAMLAVNEEAKIAVLSLFPLKHNIDTLKNDVEIGKTKIADILKHRPTNETIPLEDILEATVVKFTNVYLTSDPNDSAFDVYSGNLPSFNLVYDTTFLDKIYDTDSSIEVENLISIYDMLVSKDLDAPGLGLVTLANLPYTRYKNSVAFILNKACETCYTFTHHKAMRYKAVDAMLKFLKYYKLSTPYSRSIGRCDWKILKQLLFKYGSYNFTVLSKMHFLKLDYEGDTIYPLYSD